MIGFCPVVSVHCHWSVIETGEKILFDAPDIGCIFHKAVQHKADMLDMEFHEAALDCPGFFHFPADPDLLLLGSAYFQDQFPDLVDLSFHLRIVYFQG